LLLETMRKQGLQKEALGLEATEDQRQRCLARPGMTEGKLDFLLSQQMSPAERAAYADFVVDSSPRGLGLAASLSVARAKVADIVQRLLDRHGGPWPIASIRESHPGTAIECVTFDLDDTLFPTKASLGKALVAFRAAVARLAPKLWEHCGQGATFGEAMQDAFRAVARENSRLRHDFSQLRRLALERLLARVDEVNSEEIIEQALNAFLSARGDVEQHLFEDVLPTLKELKQRGLRIGSVTNGNAELSLHAPRLSELLDFQISSANAGAPKPRAAPFLASAAAAGTWPCQVLHVGDSLADDVLGAKRMGMKAVHLRRGTVKDDAQATSAAPDASIASLSELPALLTSWNE
ncbi:unnamed protein product, partial [Symbiodinium sp. CCMP2456]